MKIDFEIIPVDVLTVNILRRELSSAEQIVKVMILYGYAESLSSVRAIISHKLSSRNRFGLDFDGDVIVESEFGNKGEDAADRVIQSSMEKMIERIRDADLFEIHSIGIGSVKLGGWISIAAAAGIMYACIDRTIIASLEEGWKLTKSHDFITQMIPKVESYILNAFKIESGKDNPYQRDDLTLTLGMPRDPDEEVALMLKLDRAGKPLKRRPRR